MKRIFISSTFKDMQLERDLFHTVITPTLNGYAREYGESVSFCDLRWGVNTDKLDSESCSKKVLSVCLDEIDRCDRTGSMPYIIVLIGNRYGWLPDKSLIQSAAEKKHFELDEAEKSVTALEIEYGALRDSSHLSRTLFYFREFEDDIPVDSKFAVDGDSEEERILYKQRLEALKAKIKKIAGNRVKTYRVKLDNDGESLVGLESFAEMVTNDLHTLMEEEWKKYALIPPHDRFILSQWNIVEQKSAQFGAREDVVNSIINSTESNRGLTAIRGKTGSGKSTLLSCLANRFKEKDIDVLPLFCGSTMELSNSIDVLQHIVYELESRMQLSHINDPYNISERTDSVDLFNNLRDRLNSLMYDYNGKELVIIIDAVDQLVSDERRDDLVFLPDQANDKVKIIFSCLDDFLPDKILTLNCKTIQLNDLNKNEMLLSVNSILKYLGRELESRVIDEICSKPAAANPLYLSLLIQRLIMMDKHDFEDIRIQGDSDEARADHKIKVIHSISDTVEGACFDIAREASARIGNDFALSALEYLAFSKNGLRESDLEQILRNQGLDWNSLDFSILTNYLQGFFIMREDGRIDFTHKTIRKGIVDRCETAERKHQNIRNHLHTLKWTDRIRLEETVYQCYKANDKDYFVWYIEDIVKDDFYMGINSATKCLYDILNNDGNEWIESILSESYTKTLASHFYRFICVYLRTHYLHSSKKCEEIIKIMQAAAIRYSAFADSDSIEDNLTMAEINFCIGETFSDISKYALAEQFFTDAIRLYKKVQDGNDNSADIELASVYNAYGLMLRKQNKYDQSLYYLDLSLSIREKAKKYDRSLSAGYHNMAMHYFEIGDYNQALTYCKKAVDVIEKCATEDESASATLLITIYGRIALTYERLGMDEQGITYIDKAMRIAQKYASRSPEDFEISLGYTNNANGLLLEKIGKSEQAIECYKNAIRIFEKNAVKSPEKYEEDLATTICNLANAYDKSASTYDLSQKEYVRGILIKEKLLHEGKVTIGFSLATSYNNLATLFFKQKKYGEARHYYLLAVSTALKCDINDLYINRKTFALFYSNVAETYAKLLRPIKGVKYAGYSLGINQCQSFEEFESYYRKQLAIKCNRVSLKKDDSVHPLIISNLLANLSLLSYFICSLFQRELVPSALLGIIIAAYITGLFACITGSREVCLSNKQKIFLGVSWYVSCGLVTVWFVFFHILFSRSERKCGNVQKTVKLSKEDSVSGLNAAELQEKIEKLTLENEMLEKRLEIVRNAKFSSRRAILIIFTLIISLLAVRLFFTFKNDVFEYFEFLKDPSNKNIFSLLSNKAQAQYIYNEMAQRAGRNGFILGMITFIPTMLLNIILAFLNIKHVWELGVIKRNILIVFSILSLGLLTGVVSFLLYFTDTRTNNTSMLGLVILCIFIPLSWPIALSFLIKSNSQKYGHSVNNMLEIRIYRNTERINQYKLELIRNNFN